MPHPRYTLETRSNKGGSHRQLSQEVIDYIHEMAALDGTDLDIITAVEQEFNGLHISVGSVTKYSKDARLERRGQHRIDYPVNTKKHQRISELFKLGLKPMQIHRRMHQEHFKVSKRFIRTYLREQGLMVSRRTRKAVVEKKILVSYNDGTEVEHEVPVTIGGSSLPMVSFDDVLHGINEEQQVSEEVLLETPASTFSTMVQVYQNALNQIDAVIRPSIVKGLEAAKQLEDTNSVLAELEFLRKAMDIPNSILESQKADQETTIQQVASNQSQAVMKALYEEQQEKRDAELQRKAYQDANAGEGSLNQRT